ncbi:MAG: HNH endonuclease signature motif containing protein, partial [Microbacterium sp.]
RADALCDLTIRGGGHDIEPVVAITVPALTLLGHDDAPATLDGYGPIDLETARRLAGGAKSWIRILTDPVAGTVVDVDRKTRRVPADLRRWAMIVHSTCIFPGCNRLARECDLDHRVDWQFGGPTAGTNLGPVCASHHAVKHETRWRLEREPDTGRLFWISPTGVVTDVDPPPF